MATDTSHYRIPLLQGSDDYPSWKVYVIDTLTDAGLDDHIDPGFTVPTDTTELAKWMKADRRALSIIRLRVGPDIVHHVQGETVALEAWQTLSSAFETTGLLGVVLARNRLYTTRATDDESLETHIKTMRRIQGELKSLGKPIEDPDFAVALLGSLPASWDSFCSRLPVHHHQKCRRPKTL